MAHSSQPGNFELGQGSLGAGGSSTPPGIGLLQLTTVPSAGSFPSGGAVGVGLQLAQLSTIPSAGSFPSGGVVQLGATDERVTEAFLEAWSTSSAAESRVTEAFLETWSTPPAELRVTETFLEVFVSVLPAPALQPRGGGFKRIVWPVPNCYDCMLWEDKVAYRRLNLRRRECPTIEDWDGRTIPALGEEFLVTQSIPTPTTVSGDNVVVTYRPGPGQIGILYGLVMWYSGTGFVPGSGDILWRLQVGRVWAQGRGAVNIPQGAPGSPWPIQDYIPIEQSQTVSILVNVPNLSGLIQIGSSLVVCALQGWTWPAE